VTSPINAVGTGHWTPSRYPLGLRVLEGPPVTKTLGEAWKPTTTICITEADGLAGAKGPMGGGGIKKYVQLLDSEAFGRS
jgi:hypothetical protein